MGGATHARSFVTSDLQSQSQRIYAGSLCVCVCVYMCARVHLLGFYAFTCSCVFIVRQGSKERATLFRDAR